VITELQVALVGEGRYFQASPSGFPNQSITVMWSAISHWRGH